jgi:DNA-binding response OmpR family regulator
MERVKVLLVDDEKEFLESLVKVLNRRGFLACGVPSGEEALGRMERESFDVVILDVMMPGIDGIETLKTMKAKWPETEVILLTAVGSTEMGIKGMRAGAFDYVLKPMDLDELVEKIHQARERTWLKLEAALDREGKKDKK